MKMVNYKCVKCGREQYELYERDEDPERFLRCSVCGYTMNVFNFKNNSQRWEYCDKKFEMKVN